MTTQAATLSAPIGRMPWLDGLAEPLQEGALKVFRTGEAMQRVKSWLNGTPLRHRLHPALIVVPLGAWTTGLLLDALELADERPGRWAAGADAAVALGLVGAIPAAAAGIADWVDTYDHQRRVGMAHALANSVALGCYGVSLGLRLAGRRGAARVASGLGFGVATLGGMLGGELVYTLGVNVPYTLYPKPPDEFVDVLASAELPEGRPVVAKAGGVPVLLVRRGGAIHAVDDTCPHAGGPLHEGELVGDEIRCPWHDSRFCVRDGRPTRGPAAVPLRTFEVREAGGRIRVRPSDVARSWPPARTGPEAPSLAADD